MRYELMLPYQIRKAIDENWPVILSSGVLEYHAEQCSVGTDAIIINKIVDELEKELDMVILPPLLYGVSSHAVASPEKNGTINVRAESLRSFGVDIFTGLLRVGFRNIHVLCWHQAENFESGMPTDLALKLAAKEAVFAFLEQENGEGWWGDNKMRHYYDDHEAGKNPFNWINFHPIHNSKNHEKYPPDHAGIAETSLMMALCPESVDMKYWDNKIWYAESAKKASKKYGLKFKKVIKDNIKQILLKTQIKD
jgi:creatinine amidohydrolase/Fe(II)-dependent formamide hydrolase-like protein